MEQKLIDHLEKELADLEQQMIDYEDSLDLDFITVDSREFIHYKSMLDRVLLLNKQLTELYDYMEWPHTTIDYF